MKKHPNAPKEIITRPGRYFTDFQVKRAAGLVSNFLNYKEMIDREEIVPESTKAGPICMHQYKQIFGVTR